MKNLLSLLLVSLLLSLLPAPATAQTAAMERYKNMTTLTASVKQTKHNVAFTTEIITSGNFYFKKPDKMCLRLNEGRDMLLMNGETFTIVTGDGKKSTTSASDNSQLASLQAMFKSLASGNADDISDMSLTDVADVDMEQQGSTFIVTITPNVSDEKAHRKMMYTSFVLTIDTEACELRSLRMNERGSNYTQYDFSNYVFDAAVSDDVFNP